VSHKVPDSESEDDGEELKELSHPAKRSRSSHHVLEDVHEDNEEEDTKPIIAPRTRRAGSRPVLSSTNGKTGKDKIALAEDEPDEYVTAKPTSRTRSPGKSGNSSKPSTSRRSGRSSRSAAVSVKAEPLDEPTLESIDDVDGGEIEVPSQRRMTKRSSRKVKSLTPPQSVGKEDSGSDTNIGENATAIIPNGQVADALAGEFVPVPSPKKLSSPTPPVHEEKSLLDDLPTSPTKTKRPLIPSEELKGPGPRLVIHKLVLVNFKSYAGCQEIGPFHKVSCFPLEISKLIPCSLSLRSSDLMVLASRIPSMRYSLCSATVPAKCDKENCPNSYTTLRNIQICRSAVWKFISARLLTLYVHSYSNTDYR
jgi:structural maintenance of chromosome 4